jgi:hypothetical protein
MYVFSKPFHLEDQHRGNWTSPFHHNNKQIDFSPFGFGEQLKPSDKDYAIAGIDRRGHHDGNYREQAYDFPLYEGAYLLAMRDGVVLDHGSRVRDLTWNADGGTPNQGEIFVRYDVGSDPTYRESFVAYYAHVSRRFVVSGQTVKRGQVLGAVGATGATHGAAHLHLGFFRTSNTNKHTAAEPWLGYRQDFALDTSGSGVANGAYNSAADPFGWDHPTAADPWGHTYRTDNTTYSDSSGQQHPYTGVGSLSISIWPHSERPLWSRDFD